MSFSENKLYQESLAWCRGQKWQWRLPILVWFAYVLFRSLSDPDYESVLGPLNLGIHELGHLLFGIFGEFIGILGGTLLQCLAPVAGMINFYRQKDFFAIALCFGWLSTNFFNVARYLGDAQSMELPLVSVMGNQDPIHDWNYLLSRTGLLQLDWLIAFLIRIAGVLSMLACLVIGAWLLFMMYKQAIGGKYEK